MVKKTKPKPRKKSTSKKLTILQKRFCQILHSMKTPNQTEAYCLAGYKSVGRAAESNASKVLSLHKVAAYLESLGKRAEARAEKKADEIIAELEKIGFSNIQDFIGDSNEIQDISKISRDKAAAVESIQSDIRHDSGDSKGYTEKVKIKLHDKKSALVDLGKRYGLFPNKSEHELSGKEGKPFTVNIIDFKDIDTGDNPE